MTRIACYAASLATQALVQSIPASPRSPEAVARGGSLVPVWAPGVRAEAARAAPAALVDGSVRISGDWIELPPTLRASDQIYFAYDCYDAISTDPANPEFGDPDWAFLDGCQDRHGARWRYIETYNNPFVANDMITDSVGMGRDCERVWLAWFWNIDEASSYDDSDGDGSLDHDCLIAVFTTEESDTGGCANNGMTSAFPGIVYEFPNMEDSWSPSGGSWYYASLDLSNTELRHRMPSDGHGGHLLSFARDVNEQELVLTSGPGDIWAQTMLFGTADATPPELNPRLGRQNRYQFDDINPSDGVHDYDNECEDYLHGVCPDPLGPMIGFLYTAPCGCSGDVNENGRIDLADLGFLLSRFGAPVARPCEDQDDDRLITVADLSLFLASFGMECP